MVDVVDPDLVILGKQHRQRGGAASFLNRNPLKLLVFLHQICRFEVTGHGSICTPCEHFLVIPGRGRDGDDLGLVEQCTGSFFLDRSHGHRHGHRGRIQIFPGIVLPGTAAVHQRDVDHRKIGFGISRHQSPLGTEGRAGAHVVLVGNDSVDQGLPGGRHKNDLDAHVCRQCSGNVDVKTLAFLGRRVDQGHRIPVPGGSHPQFPSFQNLFEVGLCEQAHRQGQHHDAENDIFQKLE